jgi:hypothetical protein
MLILFLQFLFFLVLQGFILLEEETLIILASFIWLDAAGGLIYNGIKSELESKGDFVKENYMYFLDLKKDVLTSLLEVHKSRQNLDTRYLLPLRNYFVIQFLEKNLNSFLSGLVINVNYNKKKFVVSEGYLVINEMLQRKLEKIFSLVISSKNKK